MSLVEVDLGVDGIASPYCKSKRTEALSTTALLLGDLNSPTDTPERLCTQRSSCTGTMIRAAVLVCCVVALTRKNGVVALTPPVPRSATATDNHARSQLHGEMGRRQYLSTMMSLVSGVGTVVLTRSNEAQAAPVQDSLDIDNFIRTGVDLGGNMGVSSQAGKSKPLTGVVFRDGSEVSQDGKGAVLAEILTGKREDPKAVLVSFISPWKLQSGSVFDVECRDPNSGDTAFLAVTQSTGGKSLSDLPSSFFLDRLFDPTGRFSLYGPPTDIKVKTSRVEGNRRFIEVSFSNLSQSTNAEIPRKALIVASIPEGSDNAVMLVGSTTSTRWKKGGELTVTSIAESFRAVPAPKSNLKIRPKRDERFDF